mmetsp:Transcript_29847/g.75105  ORF Transcript_29847/g.75105 Transcript_29847/m.75105 type:complete len:131 (+) Transcript_29847:88-480(+)|eukprot:CAMPEP_0115663106 /NCGR_PEP_ID=MMETSP0272-20121206/47669_1 /TAXON_ID=71861 /ORGANISM="Scrippsiella trochoidea, Strain CCMP3099" /LENGTH=130 /DNA_ID=CAMNT_0003101443 /DNA_START=87 /DNA_END=479 /DNA_ORIENTATION=-
MAPAGEDEAREQFGVAMQSLENLVRTEPCLIFSTTVCPWCDRAAEFFAKLQRPCRKVELDMPQDDGKPQMIGMALAMATQQRTVPNIFLFGKHVGGYDRLLAAAEQCKSGNLATEHADVCGYLTAVASAE